MFSNQFNLEEISYQYRLGNVKGELRYINLDLISGMKYVHLLTENSLVKVGVLRKIFRSREIRVHPYNRREQGIGNLAF